MFMLLFEDLIQNHLEKDTLEELNKSSDIRKLIFNNLTVGVNVMNTKSYQDIAAWLLTVPEEKLTTLMFEDVDKAVGNYIDETGYLV